MKRRSKTKFTQIHVSIPVRLLEDLDESLAFSQSRSKIIANLVRKYLDSDDTSIMTMTTRQVMASLSNREDINPILRDLLHQIVLSDVMDND